MHLCVFELRGVLVEIWDEAKRLKMLAVDHGVNESRHVESESDVFSCGYVSHVTVATSFIWRVFKTRRLSGN